MMIYLLQTTLTSPPTSAQTLSAYQTLQNAVQTRLDQLWDTHFYNTTAATGGGIFGVICNVMLGFALLALVFRFVTELYKDGKGMTIQLLEKLVIPILVITLLMGEGTMLKTIIGGIRGAGNVTTENVLTLMQATASINNSLVGQDTNNELANSFLERARNCNNGPTVEKTTCLQNLKNDIDAGIASGQITGPNAGKFTSLSSRVGAALASGDLLTATDIFVGELNKLNPFNALALSILNYIMAGISAAIQVILEMAALLTALIAPIFVTWSILPSGSKAITSWLSTFWGIFLFKLCYSIVIAFSASFSDIDGMSSIYMGIISSVLAPLLAGILAAGGGMGFYNAAISLGAKAIDVGMGVASGGASAAAGSAVSITRAASKK